MAQIKVEVQYDPSKETLEQVLAGLIGKAPAAKPAAKSAPVKADAPAKVETPVEEPKSADPTPVEAPAETPAEAPKPEPEAPVSKTDVRAIATALSKAGKQDELKKIFAEFGGKKLSDIAEADYPALMKKLVAANG